MYFLSKYVKTYKNDPTAEEGPQKQEKPIKVIEELVAQSARAPYIYALAAAASV